jgi:predicted Zn-dependent protease
MNSSSGSPGAQVLAFVNGQLRRELGLTSADLAAGIEVARGHVERGAPQEALRLYASLILCEPANVDLQVGLADCALRLGEAHLALQAASAVVALAPRDPRGYLLSGRACLDIGAFDEAREDLRDAASRGRDARDARVVAEAERLMAMLPAAEAARASGTAGG